MLHPYKHQLLHKNDLRERLKQVEHDRLVQLVSLQPSQTQLAIRLSKIIRIWWTKRWNILKENRIAGGKIVMPKV